MLEKSLPKYISINFSPGQNVWQRFSSVNIVPDVAQRSRLGPEQAFRAQEAEAAAAECRKRPAPREGRRRHRIRVSTILTDLVLHIYYVP